MDQELHDSTSDHHPNLITKGRRTKRQRSSAASFSHPGGGGEGGSGGGGGGCGGGGGRSDIDYSSSSTTADDHDIVSNLTTEEEDMAYCLILLAKGIKPPPPTTTIFTNNTSIVYECKTCNKIFPSFQALGGHRASHKRPKPSPITPVRSPSSEHDLDHDHHVIDGQDESIVIAKVRVHECSICGSEFPSGQALGGHMRRHRPPPLPAPSPAIPPINIDTSGPRNALPLDLNLPAPDDVDDDDDDVIQTKFHILSTPALVDCHY